MTNKLHITHLYLLEILDAYADTDTDAIVRESLCLILNIVENAAHSITQCFKRRVYLAVE